MNLKMVGLLGALVSLLVIVLLLWRLDHVTKEWEEALDNLYKTEQALKAETLSKDNQVTALEQVAEKANARAKSLQARLTKLERDNEKAKCPMPNFMRDAFRGVHRE